ncbi:MAG: MFS transporter [Chloroflexota bacterium]|nr:MFS transporter [Chloroflexota bacterium]MDE2909588.1 MFS transporter [Chloroflexota bacterium]
MTDSAKSLVEKNLNWNFSVNVLDNMFYALAISLVSQETIMPLLVSELTDSTIAVGLIPAIFSLSFLLPQLFVANHAESLPRKLPFVLLGSGLLQRLPYPLIGIALLLFAAEAPGLALSLFFIGIATAAFGGGIVTPAWFSMIGVVVPTRRRGIFFGLADGGGLLMGVIGAYFVGRALDIVAYPGSFALLFLVAGLIHAISWFSLSLTREPASDVDKKPVPLRHYFRRLPSVLRGNDNYRRFLIGYALLRLSMMAVSFFIVFGNINYDLSGADIGLLNAIFIGTQALMRLLFGWLGDRWGHKRNLVISAVSMALAAAFALNSSAVAGLIPAFICLACAISSDMVSHFNIVLEFAEPADQPTYIGLTNTLMAPFTFAGPILAGWIAEAFDINLLFAVSLGFGVVGAALLWWWVREPRHFARREAQT